MTEYKMYCVYSMEAVKAMNGNRGKLGAMAGHAFLHAYWDAEERHLRRAGADTEYSRSYKVGPALDYRWKSKAAKKVCLRVETTAELLELEKIYKDRCGVSLVTDSGLTVFDGPTTVCLGIGPLSDDMCEDTLKGLKVLI